MYMVKVGNLIWESSPIHEYGYQIGAVGIKELSSGLKIVYDKGEIDKQAKELITSAKRIFSWVLAMLWKIFEKLVSLLFSVPVKKYLVLALG